MAAIVLTACGYTIHRAMTFPDKKQLGHTTILSSFVLVSGECDNIARLTDGLLFLLNVLGGVYLGISSYLQQLCTSPTHSDISMEMTVRGDVQFGCNMPLSLFRRMTRRWPVCILWIILLATSLPAHLLLNGSIGTAPTGLPFQLSILYQNMTSPYIVSESMWDNLSGWDCTNTLFELAGSRLTSPYLARLIVIMQPTPGSDSFLAYNVTDPGELPVWVYSPDPGNGSVATQLMTNITIERCLTQSVSDFEECGVVVRWLPVVIFTSSLTFKAIISALAIYFLPYFKTRLYTNLGDLICFAVENPELKIFNESLFSKRGFLTSYVSVNLSEIRATRKQKPWAWFIELSDWFVYSIWVAGIAGAWVFVWFIASSQGGWFLLWVNSSDFDLKVNPLTSELNNWFSSDGSVVTSTEMLAPILMANMPQICISIGYLVFDSQISRLWQEREWRSYYLRRKKPRTGNATNPQTRRTRWLTLPYLLSALLMSLSICLHWLGSQAVFMVESYEWSFQNMSIALYVALLPALVLACCCTALLFVITVVYFLPQRSSMPIMCGSARVVFASCCQLEELPEDGIMWGDITASSIPSQRKAGFSRTAGAIVEGEVYS